MLVKRGWIPKAPNKPRFQPGPLCAWYALKLSAEAQGVSVVPFEDIFEIATGIKDSEYSGSIIRWNDKQTSIEDVLAAFDKAIAYTEA